MEPILQIDSLTKHFGGLLAVNQVSFELGAGAILGLIGPNGSGKTTLLNTVNGVYEPDRGDIRYLGTSVVGLPSHQLAMRGIARTFQNARVFNTVTVYENMMVPVLHSKADPDELHEKTINLLNSVSLERHADVPASELSGGQQKLLEFARAFMIDPKLVLMDEPFAGVHPEIKSVMLDLIRDAQSRNVSFIVVSHEMPVLMDVSQEVICLNQGSIIAYDTPVEVSENELVIEAYLGHSGGIR